MLPLTTLFPHLPRHAEEGRLHTVVPRTRLQAALRQNGLNDEAAIAVLALLERLLDSVAALDRDALRQGDWRFVSFPAQLCALSLLRTLADDEQALLDTHFWEAKSHDNEIDAQREVLRALEIRRVIHHRHQAAAPIRPVYVAWALLKLNGRFLLHHREDRHRPELRTGNYVLLGGRANARDLPDLHDPAALLAALQNVDSSLAQQAATQTLKREMREETGLEAGEDYTFSLWRELPVYREVEGAGANHAYSEYAFSVYTLNLTPSGLFRLWRAVRDRPGILPGLRRGKWPKVRPRTAARPRISRHCNKRSAMARPLWKVCCNPCLKPSIPLGA